MGKRPFSDFLIAKLQIRNEKMTDFPFPILPITNMRTYLT